MQYADVLYKCLTAHTAQESWAPDVSPSLWAKVLIPEPEPSREEQLEAQVAALQSQVDALLGVSE